MNMKLRMCKSKEMLFQSVILDRYLTVNALYSTFVTAVALVVCIGLLATF